MCIVRGECIFHLYIRILFLPLRAVLLRSIQVALSISFPGFQLLPAGVNVPLHDCAEGGQWQRQLELGDTGRMGQHHTRGTVNLVTSSTNIWETTFYLKNPQEARVPAKPRKCSKFDANCPMLCGLPAPSPFCCGEWLCDLTGDDPRKWDQGWHSLLRGVPSVMAWGEKISSSWSLARVLHLRGAMIKFVLVTAGGQLLWLEIFLEL